MLINLHQVRFIFCDLYMIYCLILFVLCLSEIQQNMEVIQRPICELFEAGHDYKVFKIYYGIDKFMNTESDSDGKGLLIEQILNNEYGQELKGILNVDDIQNWFLMEVNYENLQYETYQNIQSTIYSSLHSNKCCIIKLKKKQQQKPKHEPKPVPMQPSSSYNNPPSSQMNMNHVC